MKAARRGSDRRKQLLLTKKVCESLMKKKHAHFGGGDALGFDVAAVVVVADVAVAATPALQGSLDDPRLRIVIY